ncbi:MAG: cbb3-type cytochrome oxidase assembly protein CcoS [Burkholderiales bacterium]|nr:cbb3-type cytochrome oxidase assembly protein CcoS [Burkholderiales bacterium]
MDILFLLIPLSVVLVLLILGIFGWAVTRGQFEDLDREGERILEDDMVKLENHQESRKRGHEESLPPISKK